MSLSTLMLVIMTVLGGAQPQNPAVPPQRLRLPDPPPDTINRSIPFTRQVMVMQQRVVAECVLVCPPGLFRRPYYITQKRLIQEQVPMTVTEMRMVAESVKWNGTEVNGTATINNLPTLTGGQIRDVFARTKKIMIQKNMFPPTGEFDVRTQRTLRTNLDLNSDTFLITSAVFDFPSDPNQEFQIVVQSIVTRDSVMPTTNQMSFRIDARARSKGSTVESFVPADPHVSRAILTDLFAEFPYPVVPN